MYSTCLQCTRDLGTNDVLETLPIGRRVAFDPAQGRLWVVCRSCGKWNLVPFDTRLESIDDCERIFRDTRTRYSTDNIGLARVREGLDLVRIGAPMRPEFASWRYGAQYKRRRMQTIAIASAGAVVGAVVLIGINALALVSAGVVSGLAAQLPRYGWVIVRDRRRRVVTNLPDSVRPTTLKNSQLLSAHLDMSGREMRLRFRRPGVLRGSLGTVSVAGIEARLLMRRVTAALNDMVGSARQLTNAVARLESVGMEDWLRQAANEAIVTKPDAVRWRDVTRERWEGFGSPAIRLATLPASDRLAVEMWLSEEDEAKALAGELALLERQWKETEELARIADSLAVTDEVEREVSKRLSS
jgi:hypothetical protein